MGYRSEVVFAIDKDIVPLFIAHIASNTAAQTLCFKHSDHHTKDYQGEGHWLFRWDHIKWYDTFEEVEAIQDFIQWCEDEQIEVDGKQVNADEYYRFVRIGEEMDDNETQGWGFDIHIERSATY